MCQLFRGTDYKVTYLGRFIFLRRNVQILPWVTKIIKPRSDKGHGAGFETQQWEGTNASGLFLCLPRRYREVHR